MPKRRGPPAGNKNARKHGFYSRAYKTSEQNAEYPSILGKQWDEINMLRVLIARASSRFNSRTVAAMSFSEETSALHTVALAISRLYGLERESELFFAKLEKERAPLEERFFPNGLVNADNESGASPEPGQTSPNFGFYSSAFKPAEIRKLCVLNEQGNREESQLLRVLILRHLKRMDQTLDDSDYFKAMRVITYAATVVEKIEHVKYLVFKDQDPFFDAMLEAVRKANIKQNVSKRNG